MTMALVSDADEGPHGAIYLRVVADVFDVAETNEGIDNNEPRIMRTNRRSVVEALVFIGRRPDLNVELVGSDGYVDFPDERRPNRPRRLQRQVKNRPFDRFATEE